MYAGGGNKTPITQLCTRLPVTATHPSPLHSLLYITSCVGSDFLRCVVCVIASASRSRVSLITGAQPHPDDSGNREIRLSPPLTIDFPSLQQPLSPSTQFMAFPSPPGFWNNRGVWLSEQVICAKSCRVCPFALKSRLYQLCVDGRLWSVMCTSLSGLQRPRRLLHLFGLTWVVQSNLFPVQTLKQKCSCSEVISISFHREKEPVTLGSSFRNVTKY